MAMSVEWMFFVVCGLLILIAVCFYGGYWHVECLVACGAWLSRFPTLTKFWLVMIIN